MKKKVKVTVYRRANRKYYQASFRLASGELIERSTKSTNKKEATAIGYEWAKGGNERVRLQTIKEKRGGR